MNLFFLLIVLLGSGVIYMLYYVFFPAAGADRPISNLQPKKEILNSEYETIKKQWDEKEREFKNSTVTIDQLKQQAQKLIEEKYLIESRVRELSEKLNEVRDQLRVSEEKLKDKDSQIQKALDKLRIKEQEAQKVSDELKEEKELFFKKEELMHQKIAVYEQRLAQLTIRAQDAGMVEELKKKISDYEEKQADMVRKNNELEQQLKVKEEEVRQEYIRGKGQGARVKEESVGEGQGTKDEKEELNDRQKQLLEYLKENKKITRQEYAEKLGISIPTAARDLKELQDKNIIKPHGPLGQGRYFILIED